MGILQECILGREFRTNIYADSLKRGGIVPFMRGSCRVEMSVLHREEDIMKASFLSTIGKLEKTILTLQRKGASPHWKSGD